MALATAQDVADRLGRDLTATEVTTIEALIDFASAAIGLAVGKDDDWIATYDPPQIVRFICADVALRSFNNPTFAARTQETLGSYSYSVDFGSQPPGMALTELEQRMVRKAVFGRTSGSVRLGSMFQEVETE